MGYILPIQPNQYGAYAGRMNLEPYDYANVQRVRPVGTKSLFEEELEGKLAENNGAMESFREPVRQQSDVGGKVHQAALSREISYVVGKGLQINTYV